MANKLLAIVVPHTHWDREWYLSFQEYRHKLIRVLDKVVELLEGEKDFKVFVLDGQVAILEDYLEIKPWMEGKIKELVAKGALKIGPLYTQPDEFLVSPEALIRNFLYGMKRASAYGGYMRVAYLPDTFGHTAQLPQILRKLGFETFFFMRGLGDEEDYLGTEFMWEAPDGSRVLTIYLAKGYCVANMLGVKEVYDATVWRAPEGWITIVLNIYYREPEVDFKEALKRAREIAEFLSKRSKCKVLLFMNGCDHMPPQGSISEVIERINKAYGDLELRMGTLEEYAELVKPCVEKLEVYRGEMRGAKSKKILSGVISARAYLKVLNYKAQLLLEKYAEPLAALASLNGYKYPERFIEEAWRFLFLNHAHDSIYGSGSDRVHVDNESRFLQALEIASSIAYEASIHICKPKGQGQPSLFIYNPLPWPRRDVVFFVLPKDSKRWALDSEAGGTPLQRAELEEYREREELVATVVETPPMGYAVLNLVEEEEVEVRRDSGTVIENEYFVVEVRPERGGELRIEDKRTGYIYDGLNVFVDEGDAGDEYNYSPPKERDVLVESRDFKASVERVIGPVYSLLRVKLEMEVPECLEGQARSEKKIRLPITTEVYLYRGVPRVDVKTKILNLARDHRFRVKFPSGVKTDRTVAETHFYAIERPLKPRTSGEGWIEKPPSTHPQIAWVSVSDGEKGLTIANRGIYEYEAKEEGGQVTIYLTLFRSVGWLSRSDLSTRRGHAGPPIRTPGAQCIREMTFEYSIIPHKGNWLSSKSYKLAREFYEPLLALRVLGAEKTVKSIVKLEPDALVLTALKRAESGEGLIVRFYNITGEKVDAKISLGIPVKEVWLTNLKEEPQRFLGSSEVSLSVGPHEIVTLLLKTS